MIRNKIKINELLFYLGFTIFITCNFLRNTEIELYKNLLWFFSIGMLASKCLIEKYDKKEILKYLFLLALFLAVALCSKNYYIMGVPIALIATKNIELKRIIYIIFIINIVMTIVTILSSIFLGVGEISQTRIFRSDMKVITRYYFGFVHPNQLSVTIFSILSCALILFWKKLYFRFFVCSLLVTYVTNYFTDSNTSLYASVIAIIVAYIFKLFEKKNIKIDYKVFSLIIVVIIFVAVFFMMNYGKYTIIDTVNEALSSRIHGAYKYWKINGIALFGNDIFSSIDVTFDQGITHVLVRYGLVLFVFMIYWMIKTFKIIGYKNGYKYQFIIIMFLFYSFFENEIYDIYRNIGLYIVFHIIMYSREKGKIGNDTK